MSPELETSTGTRVSEGRDDSRAKAPVKLRVLQSVPTYYPAFVYGGPTFSTHFASDALARLGVDIRVATTNANGTTRLDVPTDHGVPFGPNYMVRYYEETIVGRFSWAFARNVWREVRESDVVHLHDIYSPHAILTMTASLRYGKFKIGDTHPLGRSIRRTQAATCAHVGNVERAACGSRRLGPAARVRP